MVQTGRIVKASSEDGALEYVVHKTDPGAPPGNVAVTLEALMIVRPDGKVIMATFGSPKVVR